MSQLSYVGARPYIRGADLLFWFNWQRANSPDALPALSNIRQFRILREVRSDGFWRNGTLQAASAKLDYTTVDGKTESASFIEGSHVIKRRTPDIPSQITALHAGEAFSGTATIQCDGSFSDLLNGLIEINKRLHSITLKERGVDASRIRFAYALDLPASCTTGAVEISAALLSERIAGDRHYTLCTLSSGAFPRLAKLCYLY